MDMTKVTLPYDPAWTPLEWAKKHCLSYITNIAAKPRPGSTDMFIEYVFGNEQDAVFFSLKWL
jgi:hypothetical protein